jgi:hypothetical protein
MKPFIITDQDKMRLTLTLNANTMESDSYTGGFWVEIEPANEGDFHLCFFRADDLAKIGVAFLKAAAYLEHHETNKKLKEKVDKALQD